MQSVHQENCDWKTGSSEGSRLQLATPEVKMPEGQRPSQEWPSAPILGPSCRRESSEFLLVQPRITNPK